MSYGFIKICHLVKSMSKLYTLLLTGCLTYLVLIHFKNTYPRQNVHSDAMTVSENTMLGGGFLWNDLWKMSASITSHLLRLEDISPSLSELLCVEIFMLLFSISIYIFKNSWQILEERIQFNQPWTLKQFIFSNDCYTCNWKGFSTTDLHCIW